MGEALIQEALAVAVVAYCRASTAKQIASPETQKAIITKYCRDKGMSLENGWYVDPATSGKKPLGERPAGKEMLARLKRGDHVVVAHLDRLSRSFVNFGRILETFEDRGVILHICDVPGGELDPKNIMGRMLVHMLCAFADYERRLISVRTQEGLCSMKDEGHVFGMPPYGYRKVKRRSRRLGKSISVLEKDEAEQKVLTKIVELRIVKGWSYERIAYWLNTEAFIRTRGGYEWDHSSVRNVVKTGLKQAASQEWTETQEAFDEAIEAAKPRIEEEAPEEGEEELISG